MSRLLCHRFESQIVFICRQYKDFDDKNSLFTKLRGVVVVVDEVTSFAADDSTKVDPTNESEMLTLAFREHLHIYRRAV